MYFPSARAYERDTKHGRPELNVELSARTLPERAYGIELSQTAVNDAQPVTTFPSGQPCELLAHDEAFTEGPL